MRIKGKYYPVYGANYEKTLLICEKFIKDGIEFDEILNALIADYKEETSIDITFSKELEKKLTSKEKEKIVQEEKKALKDKYNYLLEVHAFLKEKYGVK